MSREIRIHYIGNGVAAISCDSWYTNYISACNSTNMFHVYDNKELNSIKVSGNSNLFIGSISFKQIGQLDKEVALEILKGRLYPTLMEYLTKVGYYDRRKHHDAFESKNERDTLNHYIEEVYEWCKSLGGD